MAVNIDKFKRYVDFISNRAQNGSITPSEFNEAVSSAQLQVFEKDRTIFLQQNLTSDFLKTFLKKKIFTGPFVGGDIILPADFEHISGVRSYAIKKDGKGKEVPVEAVKNADWGDILSSALNEPTDRFPKYNHFGSILRIAPIDLKTLIFEYFRTPVTPKWAFTLVSNRAVYDAANSVDFEWDEFAMNNVAAYYLQLIGVNLKDTELANFTQIYKQETNSIL